jgi:hypothetical protein
MDEEDEAFVRWALMRDGELTRNDRVRLRHIEEEKKVVTENRRVRQEQAMVTLSGNCVQLEDKVATLQGELDGLRNDVVSGFRVVGQSFDQLSEAAADRDAEREERARIAQNEITSLRDQIATVRVEAAEKLAKGAAATLDAFAAVAEQRAIVARMVDAVRAEFDGLNARLAAVTAEVKEMQDARTKFVRETSNNGEIIDMPAFLPPAGRNMN